MVLLISVISFAAISFLGYRLLKLLIERSVLMNCVHKLPGPSSKYSLLFGNLLPLMDTPDAIFQILRKWGRQYHPIYKLWIGPIGFVNIVNPADMALILGETKHLKKGLHYNSLKKWLRTGLLISDGKKWSRRRKILTPAFHFNILQDFIHVFNEKTENLVETLKKEAGKPFTEVNEFVTEFTLKVIGETAMGVRMDFTEEKEKKYERALHDLGEVIVHRSVRPYLLYEWLFVFTPTFIKEMQLVKMLHKFTKEMIAKKENLLSFSKTSNRKRLALLDLLLTMKRDEGIIDDKGIREEVDTFMFEGHDTISSGLVFGLMLLACHSEIQEGIVEEMRTVLGDIKRKPSHGAFQELKFMERCIKEILRLYPSVPLMSRELSEDIVTTCGYKIKKNTLIILHTFDMHRSPHIYPDPEKFDPDRFLPENCMKRHPFAYVPFSAGPRNCIGQKFAMLEMKAFFCGILGNFVLKPVDTPESVVLVVDVILRSKEHVKVKFVPRVE